MGKKLFCMLGILWLLALPVSAGQVLGQLRVTVQQEGQPIGDCTLEITRVGESMDGGYRLTEEFGGGVIVTEDLFSSELAAWMAQRQGDGILGTTDPEGTVCFRDLDLGLYLVRQQKGDTVRPYLVCLSEELPDIDTFPPVELPVTPRTGDPGILSWAFASLLTGFGLLVLAVRTRKQLL